VLVVAQDQDHAVGARCVCEDPLHPLLQQVDLDIRRHVVEQDETFLLPELLRLNSG
jgi:hypothetical protein